MRQMRSRKPAKRPTRVRLIMLCVGAAFFGSFFLTVLVQAVRGYSALKTGLGYLPLSAGIRVGSGAAAGLVPWVGGWVPAQSAFRVEPWCVRETQLRLDLLA
jgi:hypothetical protein